MKLSPEDYKWYQEYRKKVLNIVEDQRSFMRRPTKKKFDNKKKKK